MMKNWVVFSLALFVSVTSIVVPHSLAQGTAISDVQSQLGNSNASSSTDIVSLIENVTVTKFDILSPRQLGVELRYAGTGNTPAVKVDVSAINIDSKLADDITNEINILNASTIDSNSNQSLTTDSTNSTSLMLDKLDQLTSSLSESNGTKTVGADWKSPRNVEIKMAGNTTLYDANIIGILVRK
jgi:hypothetical protein